MRRSIVAIAAGLLYIAILSVGTDFLLHGLVPAAYDSAGVAGTEMLLVAMGYVAIYAVSGCYLAARLAPDRPMRHALILGALGLVVNVAGSIATWETAPLWFHAASILLVMPYAFLGGLLRERELARAGGAVRVATAR